MFVQTNSAIPAVGIPAKYVFQSAASQFFVTTGMEELGNGVSFEMYPNPIRNLQHDAIQAIYEWRVQVYNMAGENVYSVDGRMIANIL